MSNEKRRLASLAKPYLVIGAALAGLAVVLGAFGAHGLKSVLSTKQLNTFEIGVRYQMYHSLALLLLPALSAYVSSKWVNRSAFCFVTGTVLFSGSLYALAISGIKWFGPVTPLGGLFFIAGWALLMIGLLVGRSKENERALQNLSDLDQTNAKHMAQAEKTDKNRGAGNV
ncbi:DUF423 domain-containing protein [Alteromonas sp. PRIM-21]|uniref:DUF423 domain-containing protein n=1 Tax=Alteromonas sp. PRIM-21 TaxID=1454978 RepID=UPI0022B94776|nr:DUF423 domain-containing protein [Alteromonas sp. PRIM-21]MCZ8528333.1 DUF423 domain-containing protein [Alteromonas sp. PRIM-21]